MGAVIYTRVSTRAQAESGAGAAGQEISCRTWADQHGAEIVALRADGGVSGTVPAADRPGLLAALADLQRGDVLLVAKRDRIGRDPLVIVTVERMVARAGARLVSVAGEGTDDDGPAGVLMRRIFDAFAEYERLLVGVRTSAALRARLAAGRRAGSVPYGWRAGPGGRLLECPSERAATERAKNLRANGLSFRQIGRILTDEGRTPRGGGSWAPYQVQRLTMPIAERAKAWHAATEKDGVNGPED